MNRIAVFGATSRIAQEYCRIAARRHDALFVVGRNEEKLLALVGDLKVRGADRVACRVADLDDLSRHVALVEDAGQALGGLTHALVAHGVLPDQHAAERDSRLIAATVHTNFVSVASICEALAARFSRERAGVIAVIGSVAGDRGRPAVYIYGATKAAVATYLSGLRHRLQPDGVSVVTIKPGLVDTPMTAHLRKHPLFASAAQVARGIDRAMERRQAVAYVPWFWRWIMLLIRLMPDAVFRRMRA